MATIIYLSGYNNYYNRIIKDPSQRSKSFYAQLNECIFSVTEVNFNPGDGVITSLIVNYPGEIDDQIGVDYLVVGNDMTNEIESRWFVIERIRRLGGQYLLQLKRDIVSDAYNKLLDADVFVEKAFISDPNDPLLFNREQMTFNEIKTEETLLKDELGIPWIVGYLSPYNDNGEALGDLTAPIELSYSAADYTFETLEDFDYGDSSKRYVWARNITTRLYVGSGVDGGYYDIALNGSISNFTDFAGTLDYGYNWRNGSKIPPSMGLDYAWDFYGMNVSVSLLYEDYLPEGYIKIEEQPFVYDGKYIYISSTNTTYKVNVRKMQEDVYCEIPANSELFNQLKGVINSVRTGWLPSGEPNNKTFGLIVSAITYRMEFEHVAGVKGSVTIGSNRYRCNDAPYDIFCIPAGEIAIYNGTELPVFTQSTEVSMAAAMGLAKKYSGSGLIYDLQLLPYCPVREYIEQRGEDYLLDVSKAGEVKGRILDNDGDEVGVVLYARNSSFTLDVVYEVDMISDPVERKVSDMCDIYRVTSPNYSGIFQFSAAKNGGISIFNVDCQYKPYAPYIHVNPNFGGLYGNDFNDTRGLIVGGDFSLPMITDAWSTYEIQNKNYSNVFDRQVQNMEVNNSVQREREIWQAVAGTVGATVNGVVTGALSSGGHPAAAAAGAIVGGGLSAIGGIRDVQLADKLRSETMDYTRDMYGYNLGNIKALPYSLSRVSAFNPNNKVFPILEYYTCSDREKNALRDKIRYNGMTVMSVGRLRDYIRETPNYFKGQLIRLTEGIMLDGHELRDLYDEINRGVFI